MPRHKFKLQEEHIQKIQELVQKQFERNVSNAYDCECLVEDITRKIKKNISKDTLRRFFRIIPSNSQPSQYSLEILLNYAGVTSLDNFMEQYFLFGKLHFHKILLSAFSQKINLLDALKLLIQSKGSVEYFHTWQQLILIGHARKDEVFFSQIFNKQSGFEWKDEFKYEIFQSIQLLGELVQKTEWLKPIAVEYYVGLTYYFDYFVEWFIAEESDYYTKILLQYEKIHEYNIEKMIFFHSISAYLALIKTDQDKFEFHAKKLSSFGNLEMNNVLKGRVLAINFIYSKQQIIECNTFISLNFKDLFPDLGDRVFSMLVIFEYLLLSKEYKLIISLFHSWLENNPLFFSIWTTINWNQICLLVSYAYMKTGDLSQSREYFQKINPDWFESYNYNRMMKLFERLKNKYNN
jgi:hypothetical protein